MFFFIKINQLLACLKSLYTEHKYIRQILLNEVKYNKHLLNRILDKTIEKHCNKISLVKVIVNY